MAKARKKKPDRTTKRKATTRAKQRARVLPNDEAWRNLIETALATRRPAPAVSKPARKK
jgi:hypothetical protein